VSVPPKHTWDSADLSPEYCGQQQQPPQFPLCGPVRGPSSPSEGLEDGGMLHREPAHGPPEEGFQVVVGREREREREREGGGHGDSGASGVGKFGALDVGKLGVASGGSIKVNPNLMHLLA